MIIYAISGLGADEQLFSKLKIRDGFQLICLQWPEITTSKSIADYAERFIDQIDQSAPFGLLGVSFGGMICAELCLLTNPQCLILVSSAANKQEIPWYFKIAGKLKLPQLLPTSNVIFPFWIIKWFFGSNSELLKQNFKHIDLKYTKVAMQLIATWTLPKNSESKKAIPTFKIKGKKDRLLPYTDSSYQLLNGLGHFMVYDQAAQVSKEINTFLELVK